MHEFNRIQCGSVERGNEFISSLKRVEYYIIVYVFILYFQQRSNAASKKSFLINMTNQITS